LDSSYFYPYKLNKEVLDTCATKLKRFGNFESFAKKNSQVFTYDCTISESEWQLDGDLLVYRVTGNRFLRGMVRGLVGTMLLVGRGKYTVEMFEEIIESKNAGKTDFSTPAHGLSLMEVKFPSFS
jgi:tRNA pseudouridine38-40 synthase